MQIGAKWKLRGGQFALYASESLKCDLSLPFNSKKSPVILTPKA